MGSWCRRLGRLAGQGFARHPSKEATGNHQKEHIQRGLQDGRGLSVAQQAMQDIPDGAILAKDMCGIPERS